MEQNAFAGLQPVRYLTQKLNRLISSKLLTGLGLKTALTGQTSTQEPLLTLHDWRAPVRCLLSGDIGACRAYALGEWDSSDLPQLIRQVVTSSDLQSKLGGVAPWSMLYRFRHSMRRNSLTGSPCNIRQHYDVGNGFYKSWLSPDMTYSSGLYEPGDDLSMAQSRKYQRILDQTQTKPGAHILEIGCGWGGFAEFAGHRGYRVTAITISQAQFDYATQRIANAGLDHLVEIKLCDYRLIEGQYDGVVSIEMIEAVGEAYWPRYFSTLFERLLPGGRAVIQAITIQDSLFEAYRRSSDFCREFIFPGGMLLSPASIREQTNRNGLIFEDGFVFGESYARTLAQWRHDFLKTYATDLTNGPREHQQTLLAGPNSRPRDRQFHRLWDFYLAACQIGFESGRTDVGHYTLLRPA